MISVTIDPVYVEVGLPALAIGLAVGVLITWLVIRGKQKNLVREIEVIERNLKDQEALQAERETAFELANARLSKAFSDLANQSLRSNSENFLRLAEQNLSTHQEKAKRELSEREKAVEAMRLKADFMANLSHEIRTPMNGIIGMTELALDTELTGEQSDYLTAIHSASHALLTLLNNILDFSGVESGQIMFCR